MDDGHFLELELRRAREALRRLDVLFYEKARAVDRMREIVQKGNRELERAYDDVKDMRAQLGQIQKMASIGELAAGIAHELNNPMGYILSNLTTVGGYVQDIARLVRATEAAIEAVERGGEPAQARRDLQTLKRDIDADYLLGDFEQAIDDSREGAARILDIIRNLRDFIHADELEMRPADLNGGLENTIRICWYELKYKAAVHRDYGTLPPVVCCAARINQVFMNLLINAAQSIVDRGDIFVSTCVEGADAVVRIRDTGCGIPPEHLPKLFRPFFTTKPVGQGTGLGLHLAQQTVKAHGGTIHVTSAVGQGTEFVIRLPLAGPPE